MIKLKLNKKILFFLLITGAMCFCSLLNGQANKDSVNPLESKSLAFWNKVEELSSQGKHGESMSVIDSVIYYGKLEKDYVHVGYAYQAKTVIYIALGNFTKAKISGENAINYLSIAKDYQELALTYSSISTIYSNEGDYIKALKYLNKSKKYLDSDTDKLLTIDLYNNYGMLYYNIGQTDSAYYYFSLAIENINPVDSFKIAIIYGNISRLFMRIHNFERAENYLTKNYRYLNEEKTPLYKNLARLKLSQLYFGLGDNNKAIKFTETALAYFEKTKNEKYVTYSKSLLADYLLSVNRESEAEKIIRSIKDVENQENLTFLSHFYLARLNLALRQNDYNELEEAKSDAKKIIEKLGHLSQSRRYYKLESEYFNKKKDYQNSVQSLLKFQELNDSLNNLKRISQIENLELKYETDKKELIIDKQKMQIVKSKYQRNLILIVFLGILLTGIFIIFFIVRENKIKNALVKKEIEFLKNENKIISLHSILEGQEEERKRIAMDLHDNIGSMVAAIKVKVMNIQENIDALEKINVRDQLDGLITNVSQELRRITHNMTPVAFDLTGIDGAVCDLLLELEKNNIEVRNDLTGLDVFEDKQKSILLFRVFQELVQNVIKHSKASLLALESYTSGGFLHILFEDNGIGLSDKVWNNPVNLGIKSIKSRINYMDGEISMINIKGTKYIIKIPINND